mmetsp:Transcript_26824/g.53606  ORF Transcript_26824/g.53606 Transcript_26824/m.53606 type:complete len:136 (+) Transcript_26824:191-598(+)
MQRTFSINSHRWKQSTINYILTDLIKCIPQEVSIPNEEDTTSAVLQSTPYSIAWSKQRSILAYHSAMSMKETSIIPVVTVGVLVPPRHLIPRAKQMIGQTDSETFMTLNSMPKTRREYCRLTQLEMLQVRHHIKW